MNLADRIESFEMLGEKLRRYHEHATEPDLLPLVTAAESAYKKNRWFIPEHIRIALNNLGQALSKDNLKHWLSAYIHKLEKKTEPKNIGIVMAGNIPAVAFHDFLCVLISGNRLLGKLSSDDDLLIPAMRDILTGHMPEWHEYIKLTSGKLENFDAIIATGSTNTSRYFEYYFGKYPNIIRKNRNSIAVLDGNETTEDLQKLADDMMLFFGMGCRSISKIYVPERFDFTPLINALGKYGNFVNHHKYCNNYEYYKSIFLVSQIPFIDTGFLILKEDDSIPSQIGLLHYEYYRDMKVVSKDISGSEDSIQCVISTIDLPLKTLKPGEGQTPALWDYADHVDTMEFLLSYAEKKNSLEIN